MKYLETLVIVFVCISFINSTRSAAIKLRNDPPFSSFEQAESNQEKFVNRQFIDPTDRVFLIKQEEQLLKALEANEENPKINYQNWNRLFASQKSKTLPQELASRQHWSASYMPGGKRSYRNMVNPTLDDTKLNMNDEPSLEIFKSPELRQHWTYDLYPGGKR